MNFPQLKHKAVLSPMAGVTDVAFRLLAKKYGAGMCYTEFVSSTAIVRENKKSLSLLKTDKKESPVGVQLFGNTVEDVIAAARVVEDSFDVIDVNCGCPAWKVIKTGAGSELLRHPEKVGTFVNKLVSAVNKPVTVKIRAGIDKNVINAVRIAKIVENAGASALTIHGRAQKQGYKTPADWNIIRQVKESINIPVIGNGDLFTPEDCKKRLEESGVDYVMIARGAIGNPRIFEQVNDYLARGSYKKVDTIKLLQEYLVLAKKYDVVFQQIKTNAMQFTKGLEGGSNMRSAISSCKSVEEIRNVIF